MIIKSLQVRRFRSILDEILHLDDMTTLLGANGSGKSSFLRALELFYSTSPKIDAEDFYNKDVNEEITITVTYTDLSAKAQEKFAKYIKGGELSVEKVFACIDGKITSTYHGAALRHSEFGDVRAGLQLKDRGATARAAYNGLKAQEKYASLPDWTTNGAAEPALQAWEESHPEDCASTRDDGRFFGFTSVGEGYLGRFSRFLFIPAVRDASADGAEGRGSALTELMDMVVRSVIAQKAEVVQLREQTQQRYEELLNPENLRELGQLSTTLTSTLQTYVSTASVDLQWLPLDQIDIRMPRADIKLVEDQFGTAVHRTGHGLQRAFILTMLQHLALAQSEGSAALDDEVASSENESPRNRELPHLLLAIEEPELFQHPSRQRHFSTILSQLAAGSTPGVAANTQVICATHSPLFVGIDRFNSLRIIRKQPVAGGLPGVSKVVSATLHDIASALWSADGNDGDMGEHFSAESLLQRLRSIMTPRLNEGFFADTVVLVEGEDDYAALTAMAALKGANFDKEGVAVIPVGGKRNLDRPALIFKAFGIPVFLVWDGDSGKGKTEGKCATCERPLDRRPDPRDNQRLLRIVDQEVCDWPDGIGDSHCCFGIDLETTMANEIGPERFEQLLSECQKEFGIPKRTHAVKNPGVVATLLERASEQQCECASLSCLVENILAVRSAEGSRADSLVA